MWYNTACSGPNFQITPGMTKDLMAIEGVRQAVIELPFDAELLRNLRETAKLLTTHYSTQIEGNRLTQAQVAEAISGARFPGRERDEAEVRNYYTALEEVERLAAQAGEISENSVMRLHGIAYNGTSTPTSYRDGQNVIRDGRSGGIVYMPPEAPDVPGLMAELFLWINENMASGELPMPIVAGLSHYQYATIHPYYDGNGRTARLLTTLILHKSGVRPQGHLQPRGALLSGPQRVLRRPRCWRLTQLLHGSGQGRCHRVPVVFLPRGSTSIRSGASTGRGCCETRGR